MTLTRSTALRKRSPKKRRRAQGTGCQWSRCRRLSFTIVNEKRMCAKHAADSLFAAETRDACDGECWAERAKEIACNGGLQCAHIIPRRYLSIRWLPSNAMPLCAAHHVWFTHHPLEWEEFCRGAGVDWDRLRWRALNEPPENPEDVVERLRESIGETPA